MQIEPMMEDGLISNFGYFENYLSHTFDNVFKANMSEVPFLMTEKSYNPQKIRHKTCELLFESFKLPAFFLAKDSVLECYSCGRTSGVVIDIGGSGTNISPINDGFVESKGLNQSPISTTVMDAYMLQLIQAKANSSNDIPGISTNTSSTSQQILPSFRIQKNNIYTTSSSSSGGLAMAASDPLKPLFEVKKLNNVHPTYDDFMNLELGRHMKESVSRVALDGSLVEFSARLVISLRHLYNFIIFMYYYELIIDITIYLLPCTNYLTDAQ